MSSRETCKHMLSPVEFTIGYLAWTMFVRVIRPAYTGAFQAQWTHRRAETCGTCPHAEARSG